MTSADIRAAAQREAQGRTRIARSLGSDYDTSDLEQGFENGAVWAASRVTPTREQIADALDSHTRQLDTGACCGWVLDTPHDQYLHWADVLLVLLAGLAEGESSGSR